jgi:hypothetical protein
MTSATLLVVGNRGGTRDGFPPILRLEKADGRFWLIIWGAATRGCPASVRGLLSRIGRAGVEQRVGGVAGVDEEIRRGRGAGGAGVE